jgi:hypothetical protein
LQLFRCPPFPAAHHRPYISAGPTPWLPPATRSTDAASQSSPSLLAQLLHWPHQIEDELGDRWGLQWWVGSTNHALFSLPPSLFSLFALRRNNRLSKKSKNWL